MKRNATSILILCMMSLGVAWAQQSTDSTQQKPVPGAQATPTPGQQPVQPGQGTPTGVQSPVQQGTDQNPQDAKPGAVSLPGADAQTPADVQYTPDDHPLSGLQELGLGTEISGGGAGARMRTRLTPAFSAGASYDTNYFNVNGNPEGATVSNYAGSLSLDGSSLNNEFGLHYSGGASINHTVDNSQNIHHQFGIMEAFRRHKWQVMLGDDASYLPESGFGSAHLTDGNSGSLVGTRQETLPDQSIVTGRGGRISNSAQGEVSYLLSWRDSVSFSGNYGLLRYLDDTGLIDGTQIGAGAGWQHAFNHHDTMSLSYHFSDFGYDNQPGTLHSHSFQVAYGRRIVRRLAMRLSAGPQFTQIYEVPVPAPPVTVAASAGLVYARRRSSFSVEYSRGTTGGSGVFLGATTDLVSGTFEQQFLRKWSFGMRGGYAHNSSLTSTISQNIEGFRGGLWLHRRLTREFDWGFQYSVLDQNASGGACTTVCSALGVRQIISMSISWHPRRPIRID